MRQIRFLGSLAGASGRIGLAASTLSSLALAQTTHVVHYSGTDPGGGGACATEITEYLDGISTPPAFPDAQSGDTILVYANPTGTYQPFSVTIADVTIEAAPGPQRPKVDGAGVSPCAIFASNGRVERLHFLNGADTSGVMAGGIWVAAGGVEIIDCLIENCTTTGTGGGIKVGGGSTPLIVETDILNCSADLGGGGISVQGSSPQIHSCKVITCTTEAFGGGIYVAGGGLPEIASTEISTCRATAGGGGVAIFDTATHLDAIFVHHNDAVDGLGASWEDGGGVHIEGGGVIIENSNISMNEAYNGGGINWLYGIGGTPFLTISNSEINENEARDGGGGFHCPGWSGSPQFLHLNVSNTHFAQNEAESSAGGGMYLHERIFLEMDYCRFLENTASLGGGGLHTSRAAKTNVTNSVFEGNRVTALNGIGGGVEISEADDQLTGGTHGFLNTLFVRNQASGTGQPRGGGVYVNDSQVFFQALLHV
jgi:hypothetical protein